MIQIMLEIKFFHHLYKIVRKMIYLTDRLTPLFSATLCLPLPLSLKLSFYLFVVDIGNTFTLLQPVRYPTNPFSLF